MKLNGRAIWWCWLSILVVGCSNTLGGNPTAPVATLSLLGLRTAAITPTPLPSLVVRIPTPGAATSVRTLAPAPLPLVVAAPDCYETPIGGLWCLGLIHNRLMIPVEQIRVQVYLVALDGTALAMHETPIARSYLLPGERSPYGVHFAEIPAASAGPAVILSSARAARGTGFDDPQAHDALRRPPIAVDALIVEQAGAVYRVRGVLVNNHSASLHEIGLVVTLVDTRGRVIGFRQLQWHSSHVLDTGESLPFSVDVIAQGIGSAQVEVGAEGRPL